MTAGWEGGVAIQKVSAEVSERCRRKGMRGCHPASSPTGLWGLQLQTVAPGQNLKVRRQDH